MKADAWHSEPQSDLGDVWRFTRTRVIAESCWYNRLDKLYLQDERREEKKTDVREENKRGSECAHRRGLHGHQCDYSL